MEGRRTCQLDGHDQHASDGGESNAAFLGQISTAGIERLNDEDTGNTGSAYAPSV